MSKRSLESPSRLHDSKRVSPDPIQEQQAHVDSLQSQSSETWNAIGRCALAIECYDIAISCFDTTLRHKPDDSEALVGLAKALKKDKRRDRESPFFGLKQAADLLTQAVQKYPGTLSNKISVWKEIAETHIQAKEIDHAHDAIIRALNLKGEIINGTEHLSLLLLSSEILIKKGNLQYACTQLESIQAYLNPIPSFSEEEIDIARATHHQLAIIANIKGNVKVATTEIQKVLTLTPPPPSRIEEFASYWNFLMIVREKAGDLEGALRFADNAVEKVGYVSTILTTNAYLHLIPNTEYYNPHLAVQLLESALRQEKLTDTIKFNISFKPAEEHIETGNFIAWYLLGKAFSYIDSPRQAYDAFQVALRKGPSSPLPWLAVGSLYLNMNQLPDSLAAYSQAAKLLVDDNSQASATANAAAWEGLACVYERCDDQARDAADACSRAASCFRAAGNMSAAGLFEQRANALAATSRGELPPPPLREPPNAPISLLRDLMILTPKEEELNNQHLLIMLQQQQQHLQQQTPPKAAHRTSTGSKRTSPIPEVTPAKQYHHLPLPRESLVTKSRTPDLSRSHSKRIPRVSSSDHRWSPRTSESIKHQQTPNGNSVQYFQHAPPQGSMRTPQHISSMMQQHVPVQVAAHHFPQNNLQAPPTISQQQHPPQIQHQLIQNPSSEQQMYPAPHLIHQQGPPPPPPQGLVPHSGYMAYPPPQTHSNYLSMQQHQGRQQNGTSIMNGWR